jgi:hypothetical protein
MKVLLECPSSYVTRQLTLYMKLTTQQTFIRSDPYQADSEEDILLNNTNSEFVFSEQFAPWEFAATIPPTSGSHTIINNQKQAHTSKMRPWII